MLSLSILLSSLALLGKSVSAVNVGADTNVALYWGQNSAGGQNTQQSLATYCQDSSTDIVVLSFVNTFFGTDNLPEVNFGPSCGGPYFPGTSLESCPNIGDDIKTCQSLGKTVLLSLGGAIGDYGFTDDTQAEEFADTVWNIFGGGSSTTRPFGDAVVDGFDLDIENGNPTGYAAFVDQLRTDYATDTSKTYYISGAPVCPLPSTDLGDAITNSDFDFIFVQFYNNVCGIQAWEANDANPAFNYAAWDQFITSQTDNKNAKIYLGVPGGPTAASSGYEPADVVIQAAQYLQKNYPSFGGVMIWDASQAFTNVEDGVNFAQAVKAGLLEPVTTTTTTTTTTTSAAATTVASVSGLGTQSGIIAVAVTSGYQNSTTTSTSSTAAITSSSSSSVDPSADSTSSVDPPADPTSSVDPPADPTSSVDPPADPTSSVDPADPADPTVTAVITSGVVVKATVVETITSCTGSNVVSCHYVTKTFVTSSTSTPSVKYETKVLTLTENGEVFVTTTVCPLTETPATTAAAAPTEAPVAEYETKVVTLTQNGEVFVTTTVCPLTETSAAETPVAGTSVAETPAVETSAAATTISVVYETEVITLTEAGQVFETTVVSAEEVAATATPVPVYNSNITAPFNGSEVAPVPVTSAPFAEATGSASILSVSIFGVVAAGIAMML